MESPKPPALLLTSCKTTVLFLLLLPGFNRTWAQANPTTPPLTTVAAVRVLSLEDASKQLPVKLRGVITYYEPQLNFTFIQDATGGTYISSFWNITEPANYKGPLHPGTLIEIEGITTPGRFAPFPMAADIAKGLTIRVLGEGPLPKPLRPVRGELIDPKFHSQWIEVEAFSRSLHIEQKRLVIELVFGGRSFDAYIPGDWHESDLPQTLVNSDLRIQGVFGSIFNEERELIGVQLFVPSLNHVEVIDEGLTKAFSQPKRALKEIMQFNPGMAERMRVAGTITLSEPGRGFYLRDASGSAWVESTLPQTLIPGTSIEVVGFASIEGTAPLLRDAVVRIGSTGDSPKPIPLTPDKAFDKRYHGELVTLEGIVIDRLTLPQSKTLALQAGDLFFYASLDNDNPKITLPESGSWVAVTGICQNVFRGDTSHLSQNKNGNPTMALQVLMRSPTDLRVLSIPSWWTPARLAMLASGLALVVLASLAWAATLRRRVLKQTEIIKGQVEREHIAEERSRIGRELHDTLEQHLAGVGMQMEAAEARLATDTAAASESLKLAGAMLRHSRTEARRSVWDLRSQMLEQFGFTGALRELAASMSNSEHHVSFEIEGEERRLDSKAEFHLLRIAQEALTNAIKHGHAAVIAIHLHFLPQEIQLAIVDNGSGFNPQAAQHRSAPHFGLLGMRERAGQLKGSLDITSTPDQGTRIHLIIPTNIDL
ncbi:hypothetical protein BH11VER1_BH11VER1_07510 [soil metagenome]